MTKNEIIEFVNKKENYDLMYSVVHLKNSPSDDNTIAKKLIECYQFLLNFDGSKVVIPNCWSCGSGMHPIAELFIYCTINNFFDKKDENKEIKPKKNVK